VKFDAAAVDQGRERRILRKLSDLAIAVAKHLRDDER
jgi:hypothetical protein